MKIPSIALIVICLALGACAAPSTTESPTATLPPPTSTPTPRPTTTAIPTSTATLAPTATSKPTATSAPPLTLGVGIEEDAYQQLLNISYNSFTEGDGELPQLILSEMLSYPVTPEQNIQLIWYRGYIQGCLGDYEAAIADVLEVKELDPSDADIQANIPYWLCRYYAIAGQPELALPYCEQLVQSNPSSSNLQRRGIVYALLGDYEAASIDFQKAVDSWGTPEDGNSKRSLEDRKEVVKILKSGKHPFTPEVLQGELKNDCATPDLVIDEAPKPATRESLQKVFEDIGLAFPFNDITDTAGQEAVNSNSYANFGSVFVILLGPKDGFEGMLVQLQGGAPDYRLFITIPLLKAMFPDKSERAQAIVWLLAGAKLFEGAPTSDEEIFTISSVETETLLSMMEASSGWSNQKHIGDFTLSAETDPEQNDMFQIVIMPMR
jgi:tetratricopeptide (TPR) repeat protein